MVARREERVAHARMAGGFVLRRGAVARFGALWRGLGRVELKRGRKDAEGAEKARRGDERQGAEGAKGRAARGGWVVRAHWASYRSGGDALLGPFLRTKKW